MRTSQCRWVGLGDSVGIMLWASAEDPGRWKVGNARKRYGEQRKASIEVEKCSWN